MKLLFSSYWTSLSKQGYRVALLAVLLGIMLVFGVAHTPATHAAGPTHVQIPGTAALHATSNVLSSTMAQDIAMGLGIKGVFRAAATPNDSTACNQQNVCIEIIENGGHVIDWRTTAFDAKPTCTSASFLINGRLRGTSQTVCGGPDSEYTADLPISNIPNGALLCNSWRGIGNICVRLHV